MSTSDTGSISVTIRLLGRFTVLRGGGEVPDEAWGRRKTETLLKVLLTDPGRVFSQDQLLELLFPGKDPDRSRGNLYSQISRLRRALEPDLERGVDSAYIRREGQGYFFDLSSSCWIDTVEFERLMEEGEESHRAGRFAEATEALEAAVALYRGQFLEADPYEEWTLEAREGWQERYITALTRLADAYAKAGDRHRAVMACRTAFDLRPSRESVLQQLMRYHHAAGERSEALAVYERGVTALKRDLDVGPSAETKTLRKSVTNEPTPKADMVWDRKRIAVLPLVNLSPDAEDEYFANGMTEELIYSLSKVRDLKVIAQTSSLAYKATKKTVGQIGRELSIGSVLEGSVRKAGDSLRITVQLIDVRSEEHLWAEEFDRDLRDVFAIQSEISREVACALRGTLLDEAETEPVAEPMKDLEAYTLYLKGRSFISWMDVPGLERAVACFEEAIDKDPEYAMAWSGLADAHCLLWFFGNVSDETLKRAGAAADRALTLRPTLGEGYAAKALIQWVGQKDLEAAELLLRKAIGLSPSSPALHSRLARLLTQMDRKGEATLETLKALELDPLSSSSGMELVNKHFWEGRRDLALARIREILDVNPRHFGARLALAQMKHFEFDWEGAEEEFCKLIETDPTHPWSHLAYAEVLACQGKRDNAEAALMRGLDLAGDPPRPGALEDAGVLSFLLDDVSRAIGFFEKAIAARPRMRFSYWWMAFCHSALGKHDEALDWVDKSERTIHGFYRVSHGDMALWNELARGVIHARRGDQKGAEEALERIRAFPEEMRHRPLALAMVRLHLGDLDEGFNWLQKVVDDRLPDLRRIKCCGGFPDEVTTDPRFAEILQPLGLPMEELT